MEAGAEPVRMPETAIEACTHSEESGAGTWTGAWGRTSREVDFLRMSWVVTVRHP